MTTASIRSPRKFIIKGKASYLIGNVDSKKSSFSTVSSNESETTSELKEQDNSKEHLPLGSPKHTLYEEKKVEAYSSTSSTSSGRKSLSITKSGSEDSLSNDRNLSTVLKMGEMLGEGAYGRVHKALNIESGKFLAVKHIHLAKFDSNSSRQMDNLFREINVYKKLNHECIVHYIGCEHDELDMYIYLEYMSGGSLSCMMKQYGSFEEKIIKKFTKQILIGLDYLHKKGIIHRDIKGGNILSDSRGNVKLADFGASKHIENLPVLTSNESDLCSSVKGSLYWMAPELINQERHGRRVDIWSLGCTVIEMATSKHPWPTCRTYTELILSVMTKKCPPIPAQLSDTAKDFIRQCCTFDKGLRPKAHELLKHPFIAS
jgi:serine/threonine protein kinase